MIGIILFIFLSIIFYIITQKLSIFDMPTRSAYKKKFIELSTFTTNYKNNNEYKKKDENELMTTTDNTTIGIKDEDEQLYDEWTPLSVK
jgi:hypothetical protein